MASHIVDVLSTAKSLATAATISWTTPAANNATMALTMASPGAPVLRIVLGLSAVVAMASPNIPSSVMMAKTSTGLLLATAPMIVTGRRTAGVTTLQSAATASLSLASYATMAGLRTAIMAANALQTARSVMTPPHAAASDSLTLTRTATMATISTAPRPQNATRIVTGRQSNP